MGCLFHNMHPDIFKATIIVSWGSGKVYVSLAEDVTDSLEELIEKHGLFRTISAPFAIATFAGIIGLNLATGVGRGIFVVVTVIGYLVALLGFIIRVRGLRTQNFELSNLVAKLADTLRKRENTTFVVDSWDEEIRISKGGDAQISRTVELRPAGDGEVHFVWSAAESYAPGEMTKKNRERVKVQCRLINSDKSDGSRIPTSLRWEGNKCRVFLHFEGAIEATVPTTVRVSWQWPGYSPALARGGVEKCEWTMRRPCGPLVGVVIFDRSCGRSGKVKVSALPGSTQPLVTEDNEEVRVEFRCESFQANESKGFRLDTGD